jgi:hypothetical protein
METSLQLLMRDGAARIRFHPRLTADEYSELLVRIVDVHTRDELNGLIESLANKWGKQHDFDSVLE